MTGGALRAEAQVSESTEFIIESAVSCRDVAALCRQE